MVRRFDRANLVMKTRWRIGELKGGPNMRLWLGRFRGTMAPVEDTADMCDLSQILQGATAAIGEEYFLLPIHGADPAYRERVYCYELYHQMRLRWPRGSPYRLNGEVDKRAHPYFQKDHGHEPKPDLLIHVPGREDNYAVIEVKSVRADPGGILKDLETLALFYGDFGYQRAIYLIYGSDPADLIGDVRKCAARVRRSASIELWLHPKPGVPAALSDTLTRLSR